MVVQLQPSSSAASTDKSAIALPEINLQDDDELEFFSEEADSSPGSNNNNNNTATATTTTTNNNNNRNKNKLDASKYTKEQLDTIKRTDYYGLWIHLDYSRCKSYLLSDLIPFKEGLGTHHPPPEFRTSYLKVEEWREMTAEEQISYKEKKREEELSLKAAQAISSFGSNNSNKKNNKKNNSSNAKKLDAYQYTKEQIDTMKRTVYECWVDLDYSKCKSALLCELFPFNVGLGTYHPPMEFRTSSVKVCEWRKMTDAEQKSYKDKKKEEEELLKMEAARKKREERDRKRTKLAMEQQEKAAMSLSNMPNMVGYYYGDDQDIQDYYSQQWDNDKLDKSNIKYNKKRKVRKDKKQQNIEKTVVSKIPSLRARLLEEEEQLKLAQQQLNSAQEQVDATRAALEEAKYEEQFGDNDKKKNVMKERNNKVRNNVIAICNANGVAQKASAQCRYVVARIPQIMTTKDDDGLYKDAFSPNYFRQILKGEKDLKGKKLAMLEMFCEENKLEVV